MYFFLGNSDSQIPGLILFLITWNLACKPEFRSMEFQVEEEFVS